ncbi:MAG: four helix bundle protein [Gemmatimonadaceae bacterium]
MQDFRRLKVWEKAHAVSLDIERACLSFPRRQGAVLANQLSRAASSVPTNIAEGAATRSDPEFRRFLNMAMSSALETDYHLLKARDTQLLGEESYSELTARLLEVRRMLGGLIRRISASIEASAVSPTPSVTKQPKFRDAVRPSDQREA